MEEMINKLKVVSIVFMNVFFKFSDEMLSWISFTQPSKISQNLNRSKSYSYSLFYSHFYNA